MSTSDVAPPEIGQPRSVVRVSRTIPAPREAVFRAWTDPEQVRLWFGGPMGHATKAEGDVRPGGTWRIDVELKGRLRPPGIAAVGRYLEVEPPERLVYTFAWVSEAALSKAFGRALDLPVPADETRVTVLFKAVDGATEVSITHELLDKVRTRWFHRMGWKTCLENLSALTAGRR